MRHLNMKGLTFFLAVCLLISNTILLTPLKVSADSAIASPSAVGTCGKNAYWEYYEDSKTLKILGSGEMDYQSSTPPWYDYLAETEKIIVGDNITKICKGAFGDWRTTPPLKELTIPFVGESKDAVGHQAVLGYIFDYTKIHFTYMSFYSDYCIVKTTGDSLSSGVPKSPQSAIAAFIAEPDSYYQIWGDSLDKCPIYLFALSEPNHKFINFRVSDRCGNYNGYGSPKIITPKYLDDETWQYTSYTGEARVAYTTDVDGYHMASYYYYIPQSLETVTITNSEKIPTAAFNGCHFIKKIDTKQTITEIGEYAFQGCGYTPFYVLDVFSYSNSVDTFKYVVQNGNAIIVDVETTNEVVSIPKLLDEYPVTGVENKAFADLVNVKTVALPSSIEYIADDAFYCCVSLIDIYYDGTKTEWEGVDIATNNNELKNATIHFKSVPVSGISLNKNSLEMWSGDEETLQATIFPADATNQNVIWTTTDATVATVVNGVVTGKKEGTAIITATTEDGSFTASCVVEVKDTSAENAEVIFTISDVTGRPGDTVEVDISVNSAVTLNSIGLYELVYDSSVLTFAGFTNTENILSKCYFDNGFDENEKVVTLALRSKEALSGDICTMLFTISESAEDGTTAIGMDSLVKCDSTVITSAVEEGTVKIQSQLLGDINGDNCVDINDAAKLFQYSMLPEIYPITYVGDVDFNNDGVVDINDAARLFQYSMLPNIYPI